MVYICIREPTNWDVVHPRLRSRVETWNATFTIPFQDFRRRLAAIARLNFSRVENAVFTTWEEVPDGSLVLAVDDDDWFAPEVGRVLEGEHDPRMTGYHWISSFLEVPISIPHRLYLLRRRIAPWLPPKWICTTNNYAVVKSAETEPLFRSHIGASRWVWGEGAQRVKRIERRLSIQNRTLASQTTFSRTNVGEPKATVTRAELLRRLRRYRRLYQRVELPALPWARPYVAMLADLLDELAIEDRH